MTNLVSGCVALVVVFSLAAAACADDAAEREPPFRAAITSPDAEVLSGPGPHYYATATLAVGEAVEVHRRQGPYLGIRPPEKSFSWIASADVETTAPGVGVVRRSGTPSRVGSTASHDRDAVHVRLQQGERVRLLSRVTIDGVEWARIAPPSGEFRWTHADAIAEQPSDESVAAPEPVAVETPLEEPPAEPEQVLLPTPTATTESPPEPAAFAADAAPVDAETIDPWIQPAAHEEAPTTASAPEPPAASPATAEQEPQSPTPAPTALDPPPPGSALPVAAPDNSFARRIRELEIELSRRVTAPAALWRLDDITLEASRMMSAANDEAQRTSANSLATRANRFAAIAGRSRQFQGPAPRVSPTKQLAAPPASITPSTGLPTPPTLVGELRPVVSPRPDAPRFAVVDGQGGVTAFLTPEAGMNLQPLLGKQVQVSGAEGYIPRLQARHVTASRVAETPRR